MPLRLPVDLIVGTTPAAGISVRCPETATRIHAYNFSNQWVHITSPIDQFVNPGQTGASYPVVLPTVGFVTLTALFEAPPGWTQPATIAGQKCTLTIEDDAGVRSEGVTIPQGAVRSYGPFQFVAPPAGGPVTQLTMLDGTQRIIVPNACWISRIYATLALDCVAGTIQFRYTLNAFGGPGAIEFTEIFPIVVLGIVPGGAPWSIPVSNSHYISRDKLVANSLTQPNRMAAGDFIAVDSSANPAFAPFGAGQILNVYLETTDFSSQ